MRESLTGRLTVNGVDEERPSAGGEIRFLGVGGRCCSVPPSAGVGRRGGGGASDGRADDGWAAAGRQAWGLCWCRPVWPIVALVDDRLESQTNFAASADRLEAAASIVADDVRAMRAQAGGGVKLEMPPGAAPARVGQKGHCPKADKAGRREVLTSPMSEQILA